MVQLLLGYNADPNFDDEHERRPLHWYAIRDNITAMRAILQHGAEVNPNTHVEKPLHEAAERNLDTVKLLVEHGADVDVRDLQENTPLHLAAGAGKTDVVKFLVERWPEGMRETNEFQETPLHLVVMEGKNDVVKFLVERWPEGIGEKDSVLNTPLHHAAEYASGHMTELVALLVERWPQAVREKNQSENTPLHLAAMSARVTAIEVVRLLVESWPEGKEALNYNWKTIVDV
jgi:ankyrin repeat protein